jgi:predicted secreted protein
MSMRYLPLAALVLLAGCATLQPTDDPGGDSLAAAGSMVTLGDDFNGQAIAVASGGTINVELTSSAGTPYSWVVIDQPAFLQLVSTETVAAPRPPGQPPMAGGPQVTRFTFQATASGTGRLRLALRNFVNNQEVARSWTGAITVQ